MSYADDMGYYYISDEEIKAQRRELIESYWKDGIHLDQYDNEHKIKEMSDFHIQNCIKYFKGCDSTPLQVELNRRRLTI